MSEMLGLMPFVRKPFEQKFPIILIDISFGTFLAKCRRVY